MSMGISKLIVRLQSLMHREEGQDLVEYALLVALISTASIAGASSVATAIANIFTTISSSLA